MSKKVLDFKQVLDDYNDANQKTWEYDRNATLGASEAFGCIRAAAFKKHGYEKDDNPDAQWGAMLRGDLIENFFLVPALEGHLPKGTELVGGGEEQETLVIEQLSATPDGLIIGLAKDSLKNYGIKNIESDCIVAEFKSIDPRANLYEEKAVHHGQVQVQLGIIRELLEYQPMYGVIIYVDASFLDEIEVYVVKFDEDAYEAAHHRAEQVFSAKSPLDLTAEGKIDATCQYCDFKKSCMTMTLEGMPDENEYPDEFLEEMSPLVKAERATYKEMKRLTAEHNALKQDVKDSLKDLDVSRLVDEEWSVRWTKVPGRKTLDTRAMEEDGIDLDQYRVAGSSYDKLTITEKKRKT